jgi:transposase-like protein
MLLYFLTLSIEAAMDCPKCGSGHHSKDGIVHGHQRYLCKKIADTVTQLCKNPMSNLKSAETHRLAQKMYLVKTFGFRCIGRVPDIGYGTVFQWIKKAGKAASPIPKTEDVQVIEPDEMYTYVGKKLPMPV